MEVFSMSKYEYVNKNEYRPVREELEDIIKKTQKILKKNSSAEWNRRKKTSTIKGPGISSVVTKLGSGSSGKSPRYQTR